MRDPDGGDTDAVLAAVGYVSGYVRSIGHSREVAPLHRLCVVPSAMCRCHRRSLTPVTFTRITVDPARMRGVPCVRDLRFPVATVVAMVADGMSVGEILDGHPDLEAEYIAECLHYAALAVQERELPLRQPA